MIGQKKSPYKRFQLPLECNSLSLPTCLSAHTLSPNIHLFHCFPSLVEIHFYTADRPKLCPCGLVSSIQHSHCLTHLQPGNQNPISTTTGQGHPRSTPFFEKTTIFPLNNFDTLIGKSTNHKYKDLFQILNSIPFIDVYPYAIPHCLDNSSLVVSFEIEKPESSKFIVLFQNCFDYIASPGFLYFT